MNTASGAEGYIRNPIYEPNHPETLPNGIPAKVGFMLIVLQYQKQREFPRWWEVGYVRPPAQFRTLSDYTPERRKRNHQFNQ